MRRKKLIIGENLLKVGKVRGVIDLQLVGKKPESNGGKAIQ